MRVLGYIDPGSGSLIVSALVGGLAGIAVIAKMGWHRFIALFSPAARRRLKEERAAAEAADADKTPTSTP
jgi:hypothetical protein